MSNQTGTWVQVACVIADMIRASEHVTVYSSITDIAGEYGEPEISTVWCLAANDEALVLREFSGDDIRPCEHWVPAPPGGGR